MFAALVCREYGWTWQEYQNQPHWFITIIKNLLQVEAEALNNKLKEK